MFVGLMLIHGWKLDRMATQIMLESYTFCVY